MNIADATKRNLISAFWTLYKEKKIEKITIKQITDLAGYNRSTFYEYFIDIYEVLETVESTVLEYIKRNVVVKRMVIEGDKYTIHKAARMYEEYGEYMSVLLQEGKNPDFIRKLKNIYKPAIYSMFSIPEENNHRYELILEFAFSAIINSFNYWYEHREFMHADEFIVAMRSLLSNGILSEIKQIQGK